MKKCNIGCIGCGVMGGALIRAIAKVVPASDIFLFDTDTAKMDSLAKELGANTAKNGCDVATKADYLLLAVKPAYVDSVLSHKSTFRPAYAEYPGSCGRSDDSSDSRKRCFC